jgi:K+-sensing histidine kinase KdpD
VPFERLDADVMSGVEGTGLGLPLAKRLAEAMGGSLGMASTVGHGSTFWIQLPLTEAPIQQRGRQHIGPHRSRRLHGAPRHHPAWQPGQA